MWEHTAHIYIGARDVVKGADILDTECHGSEHMFSPRVAGHHNPENHLHPHRNSPQSSHWPPHIPALSGELAGPSFPSRAEWEASCVSHIRAQDSQGTDCLLGSPATTPFPPVQGLCRVLRQRLGLAGKAHIHIEKDSQINRDLCLDPRVSAGGTSLEQTQRNCQGA